MTNNRKIKICKLCENEYVPSRKLKNGFCSDRCRFESNSVENISTPIINGEHCKEWSGGSKTEAGYGWYHINDKMVLSHRYSYEMNIGTIPSGMIVMHKCDNPKCVNHNHLIIGTCQDNMTDKMIKERSKSTKLTNSQAYAIKYMETGSNKDVAIKYGISSSRVSMIRSGKAYKHVTK